MKMTMMMTAVVMMVMMMVVVVVVVVVVAIMVVVMAVVVAARTRMAMRFRRRHRCLGPRARLPPALTATALPRNSSSVDCRAAQRCRVDQ